MTDKIRKRKYKVIKITKGAFKKTALLLIELFILIRGIGLYQSTTNRKAISEYSTVVSDFAEFLTNHDYTTPQTIFDCYNYALWGGYLSNEHELSYSLKRKLYLKNCGLGCIRGESVCLNDADMLTDIFNSLGLKAYTINVYCDSSNIHINHIGSNKDITRNIKVNNTTKAIEVLMKIATPFQLAFGNHAITCVEYEGVFYYFDPTNLAYLGKSNLYDLDIINGYGSFHKRYYSTMLFGNLASIETLAGTNDVGYTDTILNGKTTAIPITDLEEFYQEHQETYKTITENTDGFLKSYLFAWIATSCIVNSSKFLIQHIIYEIKHKRLRKKKSKLENQ